MSTASLKLCKILEKLSAWYGTDYFWEKKTGRLTQDIMTLRASGLPEVGYVPAYDLGYLLRKLPQSIYNNDYFLQFEQDFDDNWSVHYMYIFNPRENSRVVVKHRMTADTPEDAACKLLIELIKQKVLKP